MKQNILIVAAHPDDEVLGCGGTVARMIKQGAVANTLILGEGKTARFKTRDVKKFKNEIEDLHEEALKANKTLGIKELFLHDFPDNRFDEATLLDIVKVIEEYKKKLKPTLIFTHFEKDLNIDHQMTYQAVITATRPMADETVKAIYAFENISSTEWSYPLSFSPNTFFDISETIDLKIKSLAHYKSEMRPFPHPRSLEATKLSAQMWGIKVGVKYAEAFICVRSVK